MSYIADQTGGKFIKTYDSNTLDEIYTTLQKYIVNNYCITYQVEENPTVDPRNLCVAIPSYEADANKDYSIYGTENTDVSATTNVGPDQEMICSIDQSNVSLQDVKDGLKVTINGRKLTEGIKVKIGSKELKKLSFQDDKMVTGTLKETLSTGTYDVKVYYPGGLVLVLKDAFHVYRGEIAKSVQIGSHIIQADSIGETEEGVFAAFGNVMINGFID